MGIDLFESNEFTKVISCLIPSKEKGGFKELSFDATFEIIDTEEWDDMVENETRSFCLRRVMKDVGEQINEADVKDPETGEMVHLSRKDVVMRHPMTCDAAFMEYHLYITRNSRDKAMQAAQSKNSKRSRRR